MTNQTTFAKGETIAAPAAKPANAAATTPAAAPAATPAPAPQPPASTLAERFPPVPETPDGLLVTILRTKRAHGSAGDTNFRLWLHKEIERSGHKFEILAEGCILVRTDVKSDTLFSCHVDTCHNERESDGGAQDLAYDPGFGDILLAANSTSACLGADDGAGIYLMLKMIKANVPGSYLFHTGEERGGIGSRAVLLKHKALLENFSRAVAFDRAVQRGGSPEVIVTQGGQGCASIEAGTALCKALNSSGAIFERDYVVSHGGSFTDTKVYTSVIDECFNIGVFYAQQHGPREWLNVAGLEQLLVACLSIQWDKLPVIRKPVPDMVPTPPKKPKKHHNGYTNDGFGGFDFDQFNRPATNQAKQPVKPNWQVKAPEVQPSLMQECMDGSREDLLSLALESPDDMATAFMIVSAKLKAAQIEIDILHKYLGAT